MAYLSLHQDYANMATQVQLLTVLDSATLNRKEFNLELTKEVKLIAKSVIKNISQLIPKYHL